MSYFDLNDLSNYINGKVKEKNDSWRRTRYLSYVYLVSNPFAKKEAKPKRPEDLFYIDGDYTPPERTYEEMVEHYNKVLKAWHLKRN